VIGVSPEAGLGQAHAAADRVEDAVERVLPESDVVVHVEPRDGEAAVRERVHAAAMSVPRVREIHNLSVLDLDGRTEASLHLKLPGEMPLEEAHEVAEQVESEIVRAVPEVAAVQTHIEPLSEPSPGQEIAHDPREIERIVIDATGHVPRETRFLDTDEGLIVFLTLGLDPRRTLAEAHELASGVEERIRTALPGVADVIVHTEP
jgi:divalent metal cation (Fe/Co/Zn/Cd) transporter